MIANRDEHNSPATLVAIIVAARRAGDRELERDARQKLVDRYGVKLVFAKELEAAEKGVAHD